MHQLAGWLSSNTAALSILGAAIAFIWSTTQQIVQRKVEADERQFQAFHRIVERVVSPERTDGLVFIDRQAAVIFELRHFPRYYDFTERMLVKLMKKWVPDGEPYSHVLIEEIELTLKHIRQKK